MCSVCRLYENAVLFRRFEYPWIVDEGIIVEPFYGLNDECTKFDAH